MGNNGEQRRFFCTQCSRCCRFEEGYVFLSSSDVERLAQHLGILPGAVIDEYCRWVPMGGVQQLSLQEQVNRDCVFWQDGGCSVYEGRPVQCRTYPFWQHIVEEAGGWEREAASCPGIGVGPRRSDRFLRKNLRARARNIPLVRANGSGENNR